MDDSGRLRAIVAADRWMMRVLAAVRDSRLPDAWVGAGALRDLVWDGRFGGGFDPGRVRDVDVAFFDPLRLDRERDDEATAVLHAAFPDTPWEAKNQAAVHTWYRKRFGGPAVPPFTSVEDAVATWPETATAVAVRFGDDGEIVICAPLGLTDLLAGTWRRNPARVGLETSRKRLQRQQPALRWPDVRVVPPE